MSKEVEKKEKNAIIDEEPQLPKTMERWKIHKRVDMMEEE